MAKRQFDKEKDKPRALNRKEIKELRKSGFHINYVENAAKVVEDFTDYILDHFYPDIDFDSTPQKECLKFAADTFAITYGEEKAEVKNS